MEKKKFARPIQEITKSKILSLRFTEQEYKKVMNYMRCRNRDKLTVEISRIVLNYLEAFILS